MGVRDGSHEVLDCLHCRNLVSRILGCRIRGCRLGIPFDDGIGACNHPVLISLWTPARLPLRSADVAELGAAAAN